MGIKDLWEVIEPSGKQYTLEEIASDRAQRSDKHQLRIAIDVALWTFQASSSKGGRSPELRLMFYRFCRLQELGVRAVFVFDGPGRPSWKRDREINTIPMDTEFRQALLTMIRLFDFHVWHAYGEAEAECAVLQRLDYVDIVMTGDVDVFLFGARRVVRQWPAKRYTAIPCYDMAWINQVIGLDRSDMILIALLRGSDYSHGSTQVGITIAEALARCKKHGRLMEYIQNNGDYGDYVKEEDLAEELRDALNYELKTGCSGYSNRTYSQTILDNDDFPDLQILRDFVNPKTKIQQKKSDDLAKWLERSPSPDWKELTVFCKEAFRWTTSYTLRRFGSLVFPAYLTWRLRNPSIPSLTTQDSNKLTTQQISAPPPKRVKTTSSSSQQTQVDSFFSVTKLKNTTHQEVDNGKGKNKENMNTNNMIIRIMNEKSVNSQRMYYVEFDTNILTEFLDSLQFHLDQTGKEPHFEHIFDKPRSVYLGNEDSDNDDDDVDTDVAPNERDPKKICRRWISADLVDPSYPRQVKEFKAQKAKREQTKGAKSNRKKKSSIQKGQRLLTDFMTVPDIITIPDSP
ncbi:PIN domain-like protein [Circinella umbellata]|nr:PIN domain-like protein [Circinella umbellata]